MNKPSISLDIDPKELLSKLDQLAPLPALPSWRELAAWAMVDVAEAKRDARIVHRDLFGAPPATDEDARETFGLWLRRCYRHVRANVTRTRTVKRAA